MTVDRENFDLIVAASAPYRGRVTGDIEPLLERLRQGTFVYLHRIGDDASAYAYIDLNGSLLAIREAFFWCAPRTAPGEQFPTSGVDRKKMNGELQ